MQLSRSLAAILCAGSLSVFASVRASGQALEYSEHGSFMVNTLQGPDGNTAYKGVMVKLGKDADAAICFDTELCRYMAGWVKAGEEPAETKPPELDKNGKPKPPPEKTVWPGSTGWAVLVDPNKSTSFTAFHGGPPRIRGKNNGESQVRFATKQAPGWGGGADGTNFEDPRKGANGQPTRMGPLPKEWAH